MSKTLHINFRSNLLGATGARGWWRGDSRGGTGGKAPASGPATQATTDTAASTLSYEYSQTKQHPPLLSFQLSL